MTCPLSHAQPFVPNRLIKLTTAFLNRSHGNRQPRSFLVFELLQSGRTQRVCRVVPVARVHNLLSHHSRGDIILNRKTNVSQTRSKASDMWRIVSGSNA